MRCRQQGAHGLRGLAANTVIWARWSRNPVAGLSQFLVCDLSSSVGLSLQHYKSLRVAVIICATLVNTWTHTQTDRQLLTG